MQNVKKVLLLPIYLIQIFTTSKSFDSHPIIGSRVLNRLGLHVFRLVLAHGMMRFKMFVLSFSVPKELQKEYYEKGYILLENVLSEEDFNAVVQESQDVRSDIRECIQGDTLTQRIHLTKENYNQTSTIQKLLTQSNIVRLFKFTAGKNHRPISHIQVIKSKYVEGKNDPQKHLHSDTFHPTMKYWFFLQDVNEGMAPFTYVEGSNRLTWKRIKWEYKKSITIHTENALYSRRGSFRVEEDELEALGLPAPKSVCVTKNTLVIVNTYGFHRRGDARQKNLRAEIWGLSRTNPFNPFVGFDFKWLHHLENIGLEKIRELADNKAAKKGILSSWHVIKSQNLYEDDSCQTSKK